MYKWDTYKTILPYSN